jgi:hypothetical protein
MQLPMPHIPKPSILMAPLDFLETHILRCRGREIYRYISRPQWLECELCLSLARGDGGLEVVGLGADDEVVWAEGLEAHFVVGGCVGDFHFGRMLCHVCVFLD